MSTATATWRPLDWEDSPNGWLPEEWADIAGYEGIYWVSTHGQILSGHLRAVTSERRGVLKHSADSDGYAIVSLCRHGGRKTGTVHRLVARAFLGVPPPGTEVCHGDNDRRNPRLDNLRYDTPSGNCADMVTHGTRLPKERCPKGHPYSGDNLYVSPRGHRYCRACIKSRKLVGRLARARLFQGHAPQRVDLGDWRCKCGRPLGRNERAARLAMAAHREDLHEALRRAAA